MKKILIVHSNLEIGGAETSLIGLLQTFDYSMVDVSLFLLNPIGELLELVPPQVRIMSCSRYTDLVLPISRVVKKNHLGMALARLWGRWRGSKYGSSCYMTKHYCHKVASPILPRIEGSYDLALSFIDPHFIVCSKVISKVKLAWLHTDYSRVHIDIDSDKRMWNQYDYIVNVSDSCKVAFDEIHPELKHKSIVIENIASSAFIQFQSKKYTPEPEVSSYLGIKLLSIGRFVTAKNFDNVPEVASILRERGLEFRWFIIGYGSDELLIKNKIKQFKVEESVIILGKKSNPYPYIDACDIYVQPSRFEGKSVAVREAQIIGKPVLITNFSTASSQVQNQIDGVICPMGNSDIADAIIKLVQDKELQANLKKYQLSHIENYTNEHEINKLYNLI